MVDPQPVRVPQRGPQQVAVGGVAGGVEPVGAPGRQAPVLALLAERVRRGADVHAHREDVLQRPAVGALGVAADGEVVHDPHADLLRHAAHVGQLALHLVLQPRVERHPRGQLDAQPVDVRRRRVPQPSGHRLHRLPYRSASAQKIANCHRSSGAPMGSGRPAECHSSSQADRLAAHTRSCSIRSPAVSGRSTSTWARVASSAVR